MRLWIVVVLCAGFAALGLLRPAGHDPELQAALPAPRGDGFTTSSACQSCHPGEHASWHASFHRTMTQPATPETVLGDFDGAVLESRGDVARLERHGDEFWVDMMDPLWFLLEEPERIPGDAPRVRARVVMTTGSHHLQTYWVRRPKEGELYLRGDDGTLFQLPWVWHIVEGRWVPNQDSFLTPPVEGVAPVLPWNTSCNMCHSVATEPHMTSESFATRSVELGIACEACHGPGEAHAAANRSPWRRYAARFGDGADPTIVNPARLSKERSAEVCGQCHSFNKELDMQRWRKSGVMFRAGDTLADTKAVFRYTEKPTHPRLLRHLKAEPDALAGRFWRDGTMRVAGREYNGLIESACYQKGEMTCLSCHSMHGYESASDQLTPGGGGDRACLSCHADYADRIEAHTHHAVGSAGSRCMNCHMPHTTYGLFTAMRSHRVDSPSAKVSAETGRPNACNLCHLDRTLAWTSEKLAEWYGQKPAQLDVDQRAVAASVLWSLEGDAAQRVLMAWAMGWKPAQEASGRDWLGIYLAQALMDPYSAIRKVAYKSLRTLPGFEEHAFDFIAPEEKRRQSSTAAARAWFSRSTLKRAGPELLLSPARKLDAASFDRLLQKRDNTPVRIIE